MTKQLKYPILSFIVWTALVIMTIVVFSTFEFESKSCSYSRFNTFSNSTTGYRRIFNRCYVKVPIVYQATEKCGLFGIFCYETDPYGKMAYDSVCFNIKTGELC